VDIRISIAKEVIPTPQQTFSVFLDKPLYPTDFAPAETTTILKPALERSEGSTATTGKYNHATYLKGRIRILARASSTIIKAPLSSTDSY